MPAYVIGLNRAVRDRKRLEEFWKAAAPTFEGLGAKRLAIYTPLTPLVLLGSLEAAFVYEFPDVETAKRWYESPAYQKARQLVSDGEADVELFIIDGGYTPPAERLPHIQSRQPKPAAIGTKAFLSRPQRTVPAVEGRADSVSGTSG